MQPTFGYVIVLQLLLKLKNDLHRGKTYQPKAGNYQQPWLGRRQWQRAGLRQWKSNRATGVQLVSVKAAPYQLVTIFNRKKCWH